MKSPGGRFYVAPQLCLFPRPCLLTSFPGIGWRDGFAGLCLRSSRGPDPPSPNPLPQELQKDLDREASGLQELEAQKQEAQGRLDEMDQQKAKLRGMLGDVRRKCQEETQTVRPRHAPSALGHSPPR